MSYFPKSLIAVSYTVAAFFVVPVARAAETAPPPPSHPDQPAPEEYQPKTGEPLVYGKKYYPTETRGDLFLEVNPLMLIKRGLEFEFEVRSGEHVSLGADVEYLNADLYPSTNGVSGKSQYFGFAPKLRIYPIETMSGVFFGFKLFVGQVSSSISTSAQDYRFTTFQVTPSVHAGYRITNFGGFTLSAYLGGGINIPRAEVKKDSLPAGDEVESARTAINNENQTFRPDFGLTVGIAL